MMAATMPVSGSGGGNQFLSKSMTSFFPRTDNKKRGQTGSGDWDAAPVKPLPNDMMVTPLRSQEWMSGARKEL